MSSSNEPELAPKAVAQGGRPIRRQATGLQVPTAPTGSLSKKTAISRKLRKERSMRIPAIENDLMNRIGITGGKRKAIARAISPKATRSRTRTSPYKPLLVGIARTGASGSANGSRISVNIVRCASPEPESPALPSNTPQPPKQPATATGTAEAKGKKNSNTPQSSIVLRPLPSRTAASSSSSARSPLPSAPLDVPKRVTRSSSGASPSLRPNSHLSRKRSPLARSPLSKNTISSPAPMVTTAQLAKVQGKGVSTCAKSSEESDSQSDGHSVSEATSDSGSSVPDPSTSGVAQAAAIKQSLLSQIEERNEGKKWDDLLGFFHGLAPGEVSGLLKTATRAGRQALRRLAGKEKVEPESSNRENDARVLARQPRRQGESVLRSRSDGEGEVTNQTVVPPRQRQFLYKAKGKARARSPTPVVPTSPSPIFDSQMGASTSAAYNGLAPKRARSPEEEDYDDDEPPMKRRKARPLKREGAFYGCFPTPATPVPAQRPQNDAEDADLEPQMAVHVNLIASFLDHAQDHLDVSGWLPRADDPFVAHDEDEDEDGDGSRFWTMGAAARRADGGVESDDAIHAA